MEIQILKLSKQPDRQPLIEYLDTQPSHEIETVISTKLASGSSRDDVDPLLIVRALLIGSPAAAEGHLHMDRRVLVFKTTLNWLLEDRDTSDPKNKIAGNLVNLLLPELETLSAGLLDELISSIAQHIQDQLPIQPRMFDIFSKIWNVLAALEHPMYDILERIVNAKWRDQAAIGLASAFNEMELKPSELEKVVRRLTTQIKDLGIDETPPYIYQLLLMSRKGQKRTILSSICDHFNELEVPDQAQAAARMEGTVMLHISFAIKQDQDLGIELLKYVKNRKTALSEVFPVACLLSAARIHRLEDPIFDLLRNNIISMYKDSHKLKKCAWIAEYSDVDEEVAEKVITVIAEQSAQGWDQVIQSLIQLSMHLIDMASSQGLPPRGGSMPKMNRHKQGPLEKVMSLGKDILVRMFELHDFVRHEILDQITSRIVTRSTSIPSFLELLETLIKQCPYAVEPYLASIKDTLDYLSFLPETTAERLLQVIQPVAQQNEQFRDGLVLVLRKSMFAKDPSGRMVSVNGFLHLLSGHIGNAQSSSAQSAAFETLGLLRRCFNQQAQVRDATYRGLGSLSYHSFIAGDIFEMLYGQFQKVYEKDTAMATPLRLEVCVENALNGGFPRLQEPVHVLVANMLRSLRQLLNAENNNPVVAELVSRCRENVASLIFRLKKSDLEDYQLDKSSEFDMATHLGMRNHMYASLLQGCYEAAIEHEYSVGGETAESFQTILDLFRKRCDVAALLKENTSGERGRKVTSQTEHSVLSLSYMAKINRHLFIRNNVHAPIRILRTDLTFVQYIVATTQSLLRTKITQSTFDDGDFRRYIELGKAFLHVLVTEDSDSSLISHQPKKGHSVLGSVIDCLRTVNETIMHFWPDRVIEYMEGLGSGTAEGTNGVVLDTLSIFMDIVSKYLGDRTPLYKEAANMMQLLVTYCNHLDRSADDFTDQTKRVIGWLDGLSKERPIEDVALAREIISLLVHLCSETGDFITITYLAQDLHALHGDLEVPYDSDEEEESEIPLPQVHYAMLNPKTCGACTVQILSFLDHLYDDMTWAIGRLKLMEPEEDNTYAFEREICKRLISYLQTTSEFTKAVLMGSHAENLIKVLTKMYKTLTSLAKYKLSRPREISQNFVSVISLASSGVTDKMYKFLTIYGQHHGDIISGGGTKKSKGKERQGQYSKEKAKIMRESRMIPNLIFVVEQFERHLIQLSRKSKVDLMQYMKRSTARDFKIKLDIIQEAEGSDNEADGRKIKRQPEDENEERTSKRARADGGP